jgi:hypothetical protein
VEDVVVKIVAVLNTEHVDPWVFSLTEVCAGLERRGISRQPLPRLILRVC